MRFQIQHIKKLFLGYFRVTALSKTNENELRQNTPISAKKTSNFRFRKHFGNISVISCSSFGKIARARRKSETKFRST